MTKYHTNRSIDDEGVQAYELAMDEMAKACRHRFENRGVTVIDPDRPGYLLHDIDNWWDGAKNVRVLDNGDLEYTSPWTGETDRFNEKGTYYRDGSFHPWSH